MDQIRSPFPERGHGVAQGRARLATALAGLLDGEERVPAPRIRELIVDMRRQWVAMDERIKAFDAEFGAAAEAQDGAKRLLSIPASARRTPRPWRGPSATPAPSPEGGTSRPGWASCRGR